MYRYKMCIIIEMEMQKRERISLGKRMLTSVQKALRTQ